jgi:predicted AlkP superfamily pyrophosphatase or phosphodiesterase
LSFLFFALAGVLLGQPPAARGVLLSIDGLRPGYITDAPRHGLKVPNLRRVMEEGVWARSVTGVLPTVTYPSHTTLLTGVAPALHGIISNQTFDPLRKNFGGWYWYAEDIKALTLWEAVTRAGGDVLNVHWPVSVGVPVRWNLPQYWRADTPDDRKLVRALSTTGLVDELERAIGPYANGANETLGGDRTRAAAAAWLLRAKKPRFATVYLTALDHSQHTYGPFSKDALATLEGIDEAVGQIREAAGPDATLCVVSDHEFLGIQKEIAPNAVLAKAGLIDLKPDGSVVDWQASAWVSGGTAAILARGAEAAQKARAAFGDLEGLARIIEAAELKSAEGYPDAAFVLAAARGYGFSGDVTGAPVRNSVSRGTHGYPPAIGDMDASFFLAGPGVSRRGDLGRIDMRDIAPSLAALLGVRLPDARG